MYEGEDVRVCLEMSGSLLGETSLYSRDHAKKFWQEATNNLSEVPSSFCLHDQMSRIDQ